MAFLQAVTANRTPHPAHVAPLADPEWPREAVEVKILIYMTYFKGCTIR